MNLLLLLSALLSALTGVSAGGRAVEPRAVERVVVSVAAPRVAAATQRPADVGARLAAAGVERVALPSVPAMVAPLYLMRRRE